MTPTEIHNHAMTLCDVADALDKSADADLLATAANLLRVAGTLELRAARQTAEQPSRAILIRSGVTLLLQTGETCDAASAAAVTAWAIRDPTTPAAMLDELKELLNRAWSMT